MSAFDNESDVVDPSSIEINQTQENVQANERANLGVQSTSSACFVGNLNVRGKLKLVL
jgi:hypothetical protein